MKNSLNLFQSTKYLAITDGNIKHLETAYTGNYSVSVRKEQLRGHVNISAYSHI